LRNFTGAGPYYKGKALIHKTEERMKSGTRIGLAFVLGSLTGLLFSLSNGHDFLSALQPAFFFGILTMSLVTLLTQGMALARRKGYAEWVGFVPVLVLNVFGLIVLMLLPKRDG
jgi:hypothetical protein